jgi:hypothetical protein
MRLKTAPGMSPCRSRAIPCNVVTSCCTKRVDDAEPAVEHDPVLHVLGSERVAIGVQRRGGDHGIPGRQPVALCKRQSRFLRVNRKRLHRQQAARHGQQGANFRP